MIRIQLFWFMHKYSEPAPASTYIRPLPDPSSFCTVCEKETLNPIKPNIVNEKVKFCSRTCFGYYKNVHDTFTSTFRWKFTEINLEKILLFLCVTTITIIFITSTNQCGTECMRYNHNIHAATIVGKV